MNHIWHCNFILNVSTKFVHSSKTTDEFKNIFAFHFRTKANFSVSLVSSKFLWIFTLHSEFEYKWIVHKADHRLSSYFWMRLTVKHCGMINENGIPLDWVSSERHRCFVRSQMYIVYMHRIFISDILSIYLLVCVNGKDWSRSPFFPLALFKYASLWVTVKRFHHFDTFSVCWNYLNIKHTWPLSKSIPNSVATTESIFISKVSVKADFFCRFRIAKYVKCGC